MLLEGVLNLSVFTSLVSCVIYMRTTKAVRDEEYSTPPQIGLDCSSYRIVMMITSVEKFGYRYKI